MYALLEQFPWHRASSVLTVVVVASFFITSADSGSFVVDMLTSGGQADPPRSGSVCSGAEGAIATTLLYAGGLEGLKAAAICTGLPFWVV